jgi:hypothetical protein
MTIEEIYTRFHALLDRAEDLHNKCKEDHTVESLIDTFYHFHFLALAFHEDCHAYLIGFFAPNELQGLVSEINETLACSAIHLKVSQEKLHTTVIDDIIKGLGTSDSPNLLN